MNSRTKEYEERLRQIVMSDEFHDEYEAWLPECLEKIGVEGGRVTIQQLGSAILLSMFRGAEIIDRKTCCERN